MVERRRRRKEFRRSRRKNKVQLISGGIEDVFVVLFVFVGVVRVGENDVPQLGDRFVHGGEIVGRRA